jgi:hypothetical protein
VFDFFGKKLAYPIFIPQTTATSMLLIINVIDV